MLFSLENAASRKRKYPEIADRQTRADVQTRKGSDNLLARLIEVFPHIARKLGLIK